MISSSSLDYAFLHSKLLLPTLNAHDIAAFSWTFLFIFFPATAPCSSDSRLVAGRATAGGFTVTQRGCYESYWLFVSSCSNHQRLRDPGTPKQRVVVDVVGASQINVGPVVYPGRLLTGNHSGFGSWHPVFWCKGGRGGDWLLCFGNDYCSVMVLTLNFVQVQGWS